MYQDFAQVYDLLMRDVDYEAWAAFYREGLLARGLKEMDRVGECACGTGSMSVYLARDFKVFPSDISQEMLSFAAAKARSQGLILPFARQDMRALRYHQALQGLVCACDGVNYLLTEKDLSRFLNAAFEALAPGGVLAFDLSSVDKLRRVLGNNSLITRDDKSFISWQNRFIPSSGRLQMALDIFIQAENGLFNHFREEQVQRAWTRVEVNRALKAAGFRDIRVYGDRRWEAPKAREERLHWFAVK